MIQAQVALSMLLAALGSVALINRELTPGRAVAIFLAMAIFVGLVIRAQKRTPLVTVVGYALLPALALLLVLLVLCSLYSLDVISGGISVPDRTMDKLIVLASIAALATLANAIAIVARPALIDVLSNVFQLSDTTMSKAQAILKWVIGIVVLLASLAGVIVGNAPPKNVPSIDPQAREQSMR